MLVVLAAIENKVESNARRNYTQRYNCWRFPTILSHWPIDISNIHHSSNSQRSNSTRDKYYSTRGRTKILQNIIMILRAVVKAKEEGKVEEDLHRSFHHHPRPLLLIMALVVMRPMQIILHPPTFPPPPLAIDERVDRISTHHQTIPPNLPLLIIPINTTNLTVISPWI